LSRLRVVGGDLADLELLHAEWALGVGRFMALRDERLAAGVPPEMHAEEIAGDRLRFGLLEPSGARRTSVVRLSQTNGHVLVEHLVVRQGPEHLLRHAMAEAPEIVRSLVALPTVERGHEPVDGTARAVSVAEVRALVDRILASDRTHPIVLISVENATRVPLLDPGELARRLVGMASVRYLSTASASRELKDELIARGFSDKYGCYNGGVRILWPGIEPHDDPYEHLLLLPARLYGVPGHARAEHVAGVFCEMIAEQEDPRAWLREVEPAPRSVPPKVARAGVLSVPLATARGMAAADPSGREEAGAVPRPEVRARAPSLPAPDPSARNDADVRSVPRAPAPRLSPLRPPAREEAVALDVPVFVPAPSFDDHRAEADPTTPEAVERSVPIAPPTRELADPKRRADTHWERIAGDVTAAFELAAELEHDLELTRQQLVVTRKALRRAEQQRDEAHGGSGAPSTTAAALQRAEALFGERIVVLKSARSSAEDSSFKHPTRLFEVLAILALFGRHDLELTDALAKALGHAASWKPKDSPETTRRFGESRTWIDSVGSAKRFGRHITIGGSVSPTRCLQIYYDVLADGRIEIAWCGEHRPTVGHDT
jgi:hypothetical protein